MSTPQADQKQWRCIRCGGHSFAPKYVGCPHCSAEPTDLYDATLKVGDRVTVLHRAGRPRMGKYVIKTRQGWIVGESRTKTAWKIEVEGLRTTVNYHKTFVTREQPEEKAA